MTQKPVVFLGCSSVVQLFVDVATRQGLNVVGIIDSDYYGNTTHISGLPVLGSEVEFSDPIKLQYWASNFDFFIATNTSPDSGHVRDKQKRLQLINLVNQYSLRCVNLIDPTAFIGTNVVLGCGIFIGYNAYLEPGVKVGNFSQIHYDVGISHDCVVGTNTIIQRKCGIGNVDIGNDVYIGMWTNIYTTARIAIGAGAVIFQGLTVCRSVLPGEVVRLSKDSIKVYRNLMQV